VPIGRIEGGEMTSDEGALVGEIGQWSKTNSSA
jgi:hypothetical protein